MEYLHAFIDRTNGYSFHHHIGITTLGGSVRILVPLTTANSTILQVSNFRVLTCVATILWLEKSSPC